MPLPNIPHITFLGASLTSGHRKSKVQNIYFLWLSKKPNPDLTESEQVFVFPSNPVLSVCFAKAHDLTLTTVDLAANINNGKTYKAAAVLFLLPCSSEMERAQAYCVVDGLTDNNRGAHEKAAP